MKKYFNSISTVLLLVSVLMLSSCAERIEEPEDDIKAIMIETTAEESETVSETVIDETTIASDMPLKEVDPVPDVYNTMIAEYCRSVFYGHDRTEAGMLANVDFYNPSNSKPNIFIGVWNDGSVESLKEYGYAIADLNNDDVMELIIGNVPVRETIDDCPIDSFDVVNQIYELYTLDSEGAAIRVIESWSRSRKYMCSDGIIYGAGSNGAAWQVYDFERFVGTDTLEPVCRIDHVGLNNSNGDCDYYDLYTEPKSRDDVIVFSDMSPEEVEPYAQTNEQLVDVFSQYASTNDIEWHSFQDFIDNYDIEHPHSDKCSDGTPCDPNLEIMIRTQEYMDYTGFNSFETIGLQCFSVGCFQTPDFELNEFKWLWFYVTDETYTPTWKIYLVDAETRNDIKRYIAEKYGTDSILERSDMDELEEYLRPYLERAIEDM